MSETMKEFIDNIILNDIIELAKTEDINKQKNDDHSTDQYQDQ